MKNSKEIELVKDYMNEDEKRVQIYNIPNLGTLIINGEPAIDNCKKFVKILMDAKNKDQNKTVE
ncbi:hypothetical protein H1230_13240 [Paenibacillus sp. 19GGS1-52]|uniref:hypothetical protein n=1 Tax=Paenibacillus sp. 19GGS1-52 TaxID=2758563 RepID=UPI001EFB6FF4|nr:hypothetical protein [Paenibacillus sp. 19GGS1-52]ULO09645.1 hypothetical protein H1230_13240 [Paenibacillus sp. 19GGS1-52]